MKEIYEQLDSKVKSKQQLLDILKLNGQHKFTLVTFVNPFSYYVLAAKPNLITAMDVILSDGSLHKSLHNIYNQNKVDRVSFDFSSIAADVLAEAAEQQKKIVLIGAKPGIVDIAKCNFEAMYPGLNIVFTHHGYFESDQMREKVIIESDSYKPDIVIVGMGTPYQEQFLLKYSQIAGNCCQLFTCGGFIEQSSIKADYYHPLIKKLGLRWLQRAVMHSHVRNRLIKDYPKFIFKYSISHFFRR